jgi:hypothetical protein
LRHSRRDPRQGQGHDPEGRPEPHGDRDRSAGRGGPNAGHGFHRGHRVHTVLHAQGEADPALLGNHARGRQAPGLRLHEEAQGDNRLQGRTGPGPDQAVLHRGGQEEQDLGPLQDTGHRPSQGHNLCKTKKMVDILVERLANLGYKGGPYTATCPSPRGRRS